MKNQILSFRIQQPKQRVHRMLFDDNLPFKARVEKSKKNEYKRKPKHKKDIYD